MNKINSRKTFDISVLSSQRMTITGFAALWIVFHHAYKLNLSVLEGTSILSRLFYTSIGIIKPAGNVGVDIFLICSGLGLYYSLSKDSRISSFYKKRALKTLPPLLIVSSIYYAFSDIGAREYFSSVSMLDYYLKGKTDFWYFAVLIVLYAVYPLIHRFIENQKDAIVIGFVVFLIIFDLILAYVLKLDIGTRYYAVLRVPSFIVGAWLGKKAFRKEQISVFWLYVSVCVSVLCFAAVCILRVNIISLDFLNGYYVYYFINIPFSVSLSINLAMFFSKFNLRFIKSLFAVFGIFSLELYLLFERVTELFEHTVNLHDATYISYYVFAFAVTLVLSVILQSICKNITAVFTKNYKKLK